MTRRRNTLSNARRKTLIVARGIEPREPRVLRSGGDVDYDGSTTLTIEGTPASDKIEVDVSDWISEKIRDWHVEFNGESYSFNTPLIMNLNINGMGGNDHVSLNVLPTGVYTHVKNAPTPSPAATATTS